MKNNLSNNLAKVLNLTLNLHKQVMVKKMEIRKRKAAAEKYFLYLLFEN
jgi:hypothetical protein